MNTPPWYERLARRHGMRLAFVAALLVSLPTLGMGFFIDDYYHLHTIEGGVSPATPFDSFIFATGDPTQKRDFAGRGLMTWFTLPELKAAFFRPLASATMVLDDALFGHDAVLYHLHSILWYMALMGAVALLYRRSLPPGLCLLALLLFAVDEGHVFAAGWWSNRNALVAAAPAFFGLAAHLRWREAGWRMGLPLSLAGYALGFLGGETALGVMGYLGAYELVGRGDHISKRLAALTPAAALSVAYLVGYQLAGRGAYGLGIYYDPFSETGVFLAGLPLRFCKLVAVQFFMLPVEAPLVAPALASAVAVAAVAAMVVVAWLLWHGLRLLPPHERRGAGWLIAGAALSCGPLMATYPSVRNMLVPSLGGAVAIALVIRGASRAVTGMRPPRRLRACAGLLVALHLVLAPLIWPGLTLGIRLASRIVLPPILEDFPLGNGAVEGKTMYAVHVPEPFAAWYPMVVRPFYGYTAPEAWHLLCMAPGDVRMTRESASTFVLEPIRGAFLTTAPETLLRSDRHPMATGDTVLLPGVTATVLSLEGTHPKRVRFDLGRPLEDESVVLLVYEGLGLRVLTPPPVGRSVLLSTGWDKLTVADVLSRAAGH